MGRGKEFYWLEGKCHGLEVENAELKRYIKDRIRSLGKRGVRIGFVEGEGERVLEEDAWDVGDRL